MGGDPTVDAMSSLQPDEASGREIDANKRLSMPSASILEALRRRTQYADTIEMKITRDALKVCSIFVLVEAKTSEQHPMLRTRPRAIFDFKPGLLGCCTECLLLIGGRPSRRDPIVDSAVEVLCFFLSSVSRDYAGRVISDDLSFRTKAVR